MEFVLAGDHHLKSKGKFSVPFRCRVEELTTHRSRNNGTAPMATIAKALPIVVATEQQSLSFEIPIRKLGITHRTSKAVSVPLLVQGADVFEGVAIEMIETA